MLIFPVVVFDHSPLQTRRARFLWSVFAALSLIPVVSSELEMSLFFSLDLWVEKNKSRLESDLDEQPVQVNRDICQV